MILIKNENNSDAQKTHTIKPPFLPLSLLKAIHIRFGDYTGKKKKTKRKNKTKETLSYCSETHWFKNKLNSLKNEIKFE